MNIDHFNDEENFNDYKVWYFSVPSFVYWPDLRTWRWIPVPILFPGFRGRISCPSCWTKTDQISSTCHCVSLWNRIPAHVTRAGIQAYICLLVGIRHICLLRILYLPGIIARAWINLHVQYSCVGVWSSEKPRKPRHSFIKLWFLTMSMSYLHVIKSLSKISGSKKIYITIYICIYPRILSSFFVMNKCALNKQFVTSYLRTRFSNI